eukprot:CAMPEP_0184690446 /NCGR_PEP_ID=MMETSP0312-20130426/31234_1 /TAXON_ID=31354 /ORGANISM="Compsopogon coeruleus, Strain SAG 36.94" /LENGTH=283 /DNA_ID=CAMNT_0027147943 /DNA_START=1336 /DNA_END=2188 /DNA_ORIENTATION=+
MNLLRAIVKREKKVLYHYEGVVYPKDRMLHKILNDPSSETGMGLAQVSPAVESSGILLPPSIAWDWTNWSDRVAAMSMMMLGQIDEERAVSKPYPSNSSPITIESNGSESLDSLCSVVSPSLPGSHDQRNPPDSTRILNTQFEFPTIQCRQTFVCEICDKEFDRKSNMNKHIRHVHEKLRPYICRLCGKKFGQKSSIDKHVIVVHEKRRITNVISAGPGLVKSATSMSMLGPSTRRKGHTVVRPVVPRSDSGLISTNTSASFTNANVLTPVPYVPLPLERNPI